MKLLNGVNVVSLAVRDLVAARTFYAAGSRSSSRDSDENRLQAISDAPTT